MSKITRRSYKRKKIIMGASLFGAIGLVSTGFAAWVLSGPTTKDVDATSLKVGEVTDKNMEFVDLKTYLPDDYLETSHKEIQDNVEVTVYSKESKEFHFDPAANDNKGRVRLGGTQTESLGLDVKGKLLKVQNLGYISGVITVANDDVNHSKKARLDTAIERGYIVKPAAYADSEVSLWDKGALGDNFECSISTADPDSGDQTMTFKYKVYFEWGTAFGGLNPSIYFDEDTEGKKVPTGTPNDALGSLEGGKSTVGAILSDMHNLLDGLELTLTLTANPN